MEYKVPQYLHRPIMVLWFEMDEMISILMGFLVGFFLNGWWWLSLFVIPYIYIKFNRRNHRGYLTHLQYKYGLLDFKGYPTYQQIKYRE